MGRKFGIRVLLAVFFSMALLSVSHATQLINFQGRLTDQMGEPVTGLAMPMTFTLWNDQPKTTSFTELTDQGTDAQIPDTITIQHAVTAGNADTVDSKHAADFAAVSDLAALQATVATLQRSIITGLVILSMGLVCTLARAVPPPSLHYRKGHGLPDLEKLQPDQAGER